MLKNITNLIERRECRKLWNSWDTDFLTEVLTNFERWRNNSKGDTSLSHSELSRRIDILKTIIANREEKEDEQIRM